MYIDIKTRAKKPPTNNTQGNTPDELPQVVKHHGRRLAKEDSPTEKGNNNMKKFYYEDHLIRTSETHNYKYALIARNNDTISTIACSETRQGVEKAKNKELSYAQRRIDNANKAIKALDAGKEGYYGKFGRKTEYVKFDSRLTREYYNEDIEGYTETVKRVNSWEIVEIEER